MEFLLGYNVKVVVSGGGGSTFSGGGGDKNLVAGESTGRAFSRWGDEQTSG